MSDKDDSQAVVGAPSMRGRVEGILWRLVSVLFAGALLAFTSAQSFGLLLSAGLSPVVAVFGLCVFDGGFLYWTYATLRWAEGVIQVVAGGIGIALGAILVVLSTMLHLGAMESPLGPHTAAWIIAGAVAVNLLLKLAWIVSIPSVWRAIRKSWALASVWEKALARYEATVEENASALADEMANAWYQDLQTQVNDLKLGGGRFQGGES